MTGPFTPARVAELGPGEVTDVARRPSCDVCSMAGTSTPAVVDGKTSMGPWANMCEAHFASVGTGLGTGKGQYLKVRAMHDEEDRK